MASLFCRSTFEKHFVLVKNSGALVIGSGGSSVLGFFYWWLAARSFTPEAIGTASAYISLLGSIAIIGESGLGTLLIGEIVRWPGRERGLISAAMITSMGITLAIGTIILGFAQFTPELHPTGSLFLVLIIAFGLNSLLLISDQAFVGLLQGPYRMLRQLLYSALKLIFIALVIVWFSGETLGSPLIILSGWVVALFFALVFGEVLLRYRSQTFFHRPDFALLGELRRRAAEHYMLDLGVQIPSAIMPYLVTVLLSAALNAPFTVIWMISAVGAMVPAALATVLFPVIRAAPEQYHSKMALSLSLSLGFAVIFGIFIFFFSEIFLRLFNPVYADIGGTHLRLLGFGLIGVVIKYHVAAAARLNNRMRQASGWFVLTGLFELGSVAIGCLLNGLEGLALGWTSAMIIQGAVMLLTVNPCVSRHALSRERYRDVKV